MFRNIAVLLLFVAASNADAHAPQTPAQTPPQVYCGEIPNQVYVCLGIPQFVSQDVAQKCKKSTKSCDKMTCLFRESGWLNGASVDKTKVSQHFDTFFRDHAAWAPAVRHAKAACLINDLPAQGVNVNCPAYDIMMCTLASFIKNAQPSQWSNAESCAYARQFAGSCPVCPSECFASSIPNGSCNACLTLPRTP